LRSKCRDYLPVFPEVIDTCGDEIFCHFLS
jgi:hypothetical protein